MSRASTRTKLPLDRWAEILGISPIHFNQMFSDNFGPTSDCGDPFYQYAYQNPLFTSREDVARAIREAEDKIEDELGYYILPDWTEDERKVTTRPAKPELFSTGSVNIRGMHKSIETAHGYLVSGGIRAQSEIELAVTATESDADGDGYDETITASVVTTVTDTNEVRAYLPGRSGEDDYEIRPIEVSIAAGTATLTMKRWQLVDPDLQEHLSAEVPANRIDAEQAASYVTTIDVYRIFNDPQTQVNLLWERPPIGCNNCNGSGCVACGFDTQTGCLFVRDERLGFFAYRPATWDSDDEQFDTASPTVKRDPEQLRVWYYSGWQSTSSRVSRPLVDMDPRFEQAVAHLSVTLLDRDVCSCNNVEGFVDYWNEDLARLGSDVSHQITPKDLGNPFGTARGAIDAWKTINRNGRRIRR